MLRASVRAPEQKQAMRATAEACGRSLATIAGSMGVAPQTLSAWLDDRVDAHMPSPRFISFLDATRDDDEAHLLQFWAGLSGRVVVRLPRVSAADACASLAELATAFAAVLMAHGLATEDGKWTAGELARFRPLVNQLAAESLAYLAHVEKQAATNRRSA